MTNTFERLSTVVGRLSNNQQQALLDLAESLARGGRFYDTMSPGQHAALDEAIAEADRGGGQSREEVEARLDALFARHTARSMR